jgi:hypothetical protein
VASPKGEPDEGAAAATSRHPAQRKRLAVGRDMPEPRQRRQYIGDLAFGRFRFPELRGDALGVERCSADANAANTAAVCSTAPDGNDGSWTFSTTSSCAATCAPSSDAACLSTPLPKRGI